MARALPWMWAVCRMTYLVGWLFDLWRGFWFYLDEVVDDALDGWGDD